MSEEILSAFESDWQAGSPPGIRKYLLDCNQEFKSQLLEELVLVDREFRWKAAAKKITINDQLGSQPVWKDYVEILPELGLKQEIPLQFIAEEYRLRCQKGDQSSHAHFLLGYPNQHNQLKAMLINIDQELQADQAINPSFMPATPALQAPLNWSDYLLQKHIGSGGFGKVYHAVDRNSGQSVAVKSLRKSLQKQPHAVELFIQEANILVQLKHPGIISVHGIGQYPGGGYFIVLDLIEGEDLQQKLLRGPLPITQAVQIAIKVANAVQHAHENRIVHGDLKPGNVLLKRDHQVIVTDFGLATLLSEAEAGSNTSFRVGGTADYLAPEVREGKPATKLIDIYGIGAILFALLTALPPGSAFDLQLDIPAALEAIMMNCLDVNPKARPNSAKEVATRLTSWQALQR